MSPTSTTTTAPIHPKDTGSGQSVPGAFPPDEDVTAVEGHGAESQEHKEEEQVRGNCMNRRPESPGGETVPAHAAIVRSTGALWSSDSHESRRKAEPVVVEDDGWLRRLDTLESQPVGDTPGLEPQQKTLYKKLTVRQLENYDNVDIMDAMERGEW